MNDTYKTNQNNKVINTEITEEHINLFMQNLINSTKKIPYGLDKCEDFQARMLSTVEIFCAQEAELNERVDNITTCISPNCYEPLEPNDN